MLRIIAFDRLANVRDLGGLRGADGRTVRTGLLYRTDALSKLHGAEAEDLARFAKLDLRTVIDLRYPFEIAEAGRVPGAERLAYHNLSIEHRPYDQSVDGAGLASERFFADKYAETLRDGGVEIRAVLELVAAADSAPPAFHCRSGKDRTGIIAALLLDLLGVPEDDIVTDYALTGLARPRFIEVWRSRNPGAEPPLHSHLWRAPAGAMRTFLAELAREYGSVAGYVASTGADADVLTAALRERYLTPVRAV
jgi:protein-tyrosine phosphatase